MQIKLVQRLRRSWRSVLSNKDDRTLSSGRTDKSIPPSSSSGFWQSRRTDVPSKDKSLPRTVTTFKTKKTQLPDCWYYSSNHILVNRERVLVGLPELRRVRLLDDLARFHAENLADDEKLYHSVDGLEQLQRKIGGNFVGENVQRGKSIRWMHTAMMASGKKSRENILSNKYTEFGMGTAKGSDGKLYMVQLFRGNSNKVFGRRRTSVV